jgi:hypothetical protein
LVGYGCIRYGCTHSYFGYAYSYYGCTHSYYGYAYTYYGYTHTYYGYTHSYYGYTQARPARDSGGGREGAPRSYAVSSSAAG